MEAAIMSIYHEKRKINPSEARELIKNILEQNNYNVSLTAKNSWYIKTHSKKSKRW